MAIQGLVPPPAASKTRHPTIAYDSRVTDKYWMSSGVYQEFMQ